MNINPLLLTDFYKVSHYQMYPNNTSKIYSNFTPRKSRIPEVKEVVFFGLQYFIVEYLIDQWARNFFNKSRNKAVTSYKKFIDMTLGQDSVSIEHIEKLWELDYLPLEIKALPEGTLCPIGVPCLTITNTVPEAYWLVNYLETIISCTLWQPITSATLAWEFRKLLDSYAIETTGSTDGVDYQGHDFSMRGMSSLESAMTSGAGHLVCFKGTDSIPSLAFLQQYYNHYNIGISSVPATEHSVMCLGMKEDELGTFKRLMDLYPKGILSVVSDTWDLWKVCTEYVIELKEQILKRDGKLVIRPDSGDPVDIVCGISYKEVKSKWDFQGENGDIVLCDGDFYTAIRDERISDVEFFFDKWNKNPNQSELKGVVELLWEVFGGTINEKGYKQLDNHIGVIYGDGINLERAKQICERLKTKGFASTNVVFGIGSYTYQHNTRDTFGFAMKATYGELIDGDYGGINDQNVIKREIFKDPITDDGTKKSKKGLLCVKEENGKLICVDQVSEEQENQSLLKTVFLNGELVRQTNFDEIRSKFQTI